jgi:hypothetical protein
MPTTVDPVRDQVEDTLRRLVGTVASVPCEAVRAIQGVVSQSAAVLRTIVTLTVDGLLGWDVDAGVPPLGTAVAPTGVSTPAATPGSEGATAERVADGGGVADGGVAADLAIAGYEDLAASHIVARLDGLGRDDLAAIRRFEVAHRGRRTVVGKIDQLLAQS